ncbi:MAG: hypothetical protein IPL28_13385 [Chloroflexi bacterium]|nr:hypothetical protein [Chloroflexota bacterium]
MGNSAPIGAVLTNEAVIVGTGDSVTVEDSVTVLTSASKAYLPLIVTPLPPCWKYPPPAPTAVTVGRFRGQVGVQA